MACIVIYKTMIIFSNCSRTPITTFNYLMNPFIHWFTMGYFIIHDVAIYCDDFLFRTILQFYGLGNLRAKTIILISFLHFRFDKAICTIVDQAKQPGFRIHKYATTSVSPIQASLGLCNSWKKSVNWSQFGNFCKNYVKSTYPFNNYYT